MTIIQINTQKGWRGGERQLAFLIEELIQTNSKIILICRKNSELETYAKTNNLIFYSFTISIFSLFKVASFVSKLVLKNKNETIVNCQDSKSHTIGLLVKLFYTKNFKLVIHRRVVFPIKGWFSKNIKYNSKYIDSIICISEAVQKVVQDNDSRLRTAVIYSSIKPITTNNNGVLENLIGKKTDKIIGYIAAFTEEKDHFTFLKTAQNLLKTNPNFHFVLAGKGNLQPEIEKFVHDLKIENNVSFLGFLENVSEIIPEIDLLLFTSKSEGLGSTVLDFFMAKKPVVTVKNGGVEELVFNNETGYITEIGAVDKLTNYCLEIFNNPEKTARMIENAFILASENFSIKKMAEKTQKEYQELLLL